MALAPQMAALVAVTVDNENFPKPEPPPRAENPLADISAVVVYTRLSREDDRSHSPETQLRLTRDLARREGWQVLHEFTDDAENPISGKAFAERPGWDKLKTYLRRLPEAQRRKTAVLVKSFDRFSRNLEEGLATEREFRETLSVRLRASEMPYTAPESQEGRLMFIDILKFAEYERLVIVRRTKEGLVTARSKGRHLGHFPKHFEKDAEGRIVPSEAARLIVEARARGESYNRIARRLRIKQGEVWDVCGFVARMADDLKA